jgi:transaldolase
MYIASQRFSLWVDFIERSFLDEGFKKLIDEGIINGATSNPAIFKSAILTSSAYKEQISTLNGLTPKEKYEAIAIFDIQKAADILRPLYDKGDDGFVSIEVDPFLCDDARATTAEGLRLFEAIGRPNVMIKVPATVAGYGAMEALASHGIPVNATLVFSLEQAIKCAQAFGRAAAKASSVASSVISVFVSRIDRAIDAKLSLGGVAPSLMGIYNAAEIYAHIEALKIPKCRVLFASTGVKGDDLCASYYVDELLASNSVNTAPIATIEAYVAGGDTVIKLPLSLDTITLHKASVKGLGVDMDAVIALQIQEGLDAFKVAFDEILRSLE